MRTRELPPVVFMNRYGASFGHSRNPTTYAQSGRLFRNYYRFVCLRCGWAFCKTRHKSHTTEDCDLILVQLAGDKLMVRLARQNLFGR